MKNYLLFGAAALVVLSSCEKLDPTEDIEKGTQCVEDYSKDQQALNTLKDLVVDFVNNDDRLMKKSTTNIFPESAEITWFDNDSVFTDGDGVEFEVKLSTLKEKDEDNTQNDLVEGKDGKRYGGRFIVSLNRPFDEVGAELILRPDYRLNDDETKVDYSTKFCFYQKSKMTFVLHGGNVKGKNSKGDEIDVPGPLFTIKRMESEKLNVEYKVSVINMYGGSFDFTSAWGNFTSERIAGANTPDDNEDDEFKFTGTSNAYNSLENFYKVIIDENDPLVTKMSCDAVTPYQQGKMTMEVDGAGNNFTFNFGDGACDEKVKVKYGNFPEKEVSLN